jgi:hypothetical protein
MIETEIFDPANDLIERKTRLGLMTEIPDMRAYASEWQQLADVFQSIGFEANAAYCQARADHYSRHPGGAYVRTFDPPFATVSPLVVVQRAAKAGR